MKKVLCLILFLFVLFSCNSQVVNETKQIGNDYIQTLDDTPDDAQKAVDLINNSRNQRLDKIKE